MLESLRKNIGSVQLLVFLLIIAVSIYLFQIAWQILAVFSDILIILVIAWVISFILEPLVEKISKFLHISKGISALVLYTAFFGLFAITIILFIPAVATQITSFEKVLPKYVTLLPKPMVKFVNNITPTFDNSLPIIPSVAQFLFDAFIVLIISFYFVLDKEKINRELFAILPKKWHEHALYVQNLIDRTFGSYLRVQLLFGLIAGIITWIVLRIFGIDFAASTAVISGILTIIPLVGPILGIIPPIVVGFLTDPVRGLLVFASLFIMQQILFNIIGPKLLGNALKLHPVVVLLSFFVGYKIFGPVGAIFAVPVFSVITVILHRLARHYLYSDRS